MVTRSVVSQKNWVLAATGPGLVTITAYAGGGKMAATASATPPTENPNIFGHFVPINENTNVMLHTGEYLWVVGEGSFTVTSET